VVRTARSIKAKLIAIIMLTSVAAVVCACAGFAFFEVRSFRATLAGEVGTIAQIVSASSEAALAFHDYKAAHETLSILKAEPRIAAGCVYAGEGHLIAQHRGAPGVLCPIHSPNRTGEVFEGGFLSLTRTIDLDGQRIGTVHLIATLNEMYSRLARFGLIVLAVLGASLLLALLISSVLHKVISGPILHLAETAREVSQKRDYSLRAARSGEDEIGVLVERFNGMLGQIQEQDEALRRAHDETEARVVERTQELQSEISRRRKTQVELERAKDAAEDANRAKSAFLANMSHELRTPLNAIIGYGEMLQEEATDRDASWAGDDLHRICGAGRHLLTLINDVLDISKIEAGRMECRLEPVDIRCMIDDVVSTVEPLARRNANSIVSACRTVHASMPADLMKFRQSLLNLLSNACKFTDNGTVTLEVSDAQENGRPWLHWNVRDTGIGIDPAQAEKLFRPFSQVDSSTTRKYGGTGLGLAISQRFCELMGGRITCESVAGKGSTFCIHMPAEETESDLTRLSGKLAEAARPAS
jgi:signal transduction histidine kinase